jgi:hypothetical protein
MLALGKLVLEIGSHFFDLQLNIKREDLIINVHDANGNISGQSLVLIRVDKFHSHEVEDLDDLVDGVAFERHQYGH